MHSPKAPKGPYPKDEENIYEFDLKLETQWGQWSSCSKCGQVGKKHKLGYCNVVLQNSEQKAAILSSNYTTQVINQFKYHQLQINKKQPYTGNAYNINKI